MEKAEIGESEVERFLDKVVKDTSGLAVTTMAALGDRLGLFKDLAANGPAGSSEFAKRTGINERYAKEWLAGMTCAGYLNYDPLSQVFSLPPSHAPVLAEEGGPFFFGGTHQMLLGMLTTLGLLEKAFRTGNGIPMSAYDENTWEGIERDMAGVYEAKLLKEWIPAMPDVQAMLERGVQVADVGCGSSRVLIMLAKAFPNSRYVGIDPFEPLIERAKVNAEAAGVSDLVSYKVLDSSFGVFGQYDLVTTFNVIHEASNPVELLRAIRKSLRQGGRYVCVDVKCEEALEDNVGAFAALRYGFSLLYCMSTSLAEGKEALGTMGLHEGKMRQLCQEAGFSSVKLVPLEKSLRNTYEVFI